MRFPVAAVAVLALLAPLPAAAQDAPDPALNELSDRLSDPVEQQKLAAMVGALGEVLMQLPVGQLAEAMERSAPEAMGDAVPKIAPDATLRDLAGRDGAQKMQAEISDKVPMMMGMMAGLVEGLDAMRPALRDMAKTMNGQLQQRIGQVDRP
jgi:hypothetical protein